MRVGTETFQDGNNYEILKPNQRLIKLEVQVVGGDGELVRILSILFPGLIP